MSDDQTPLRVQIVQAPYPLKRAARDLALSVVMAVILDRITHGPYRRPKGWQQ